MTGRDPRARTVATASAVAVVLVYLVFAADVTSTPRAETPQIHAEPIRIARVVVPPRELPPPQSPEAASEAREPETAEPESPPRRLPEPEVADASARPASADPNPEPVGAPDREESRTEPLGDAIDPPRRASFAEPRPPEADAASEAEASDEPAPPVLELDRAALRRGERMLEEGRFPKISARYSRIDFADYRDAMLAMGGRFFVFDGRARRPLSGVDPVSGRLVDERDRRGLSPWPRDVTASSSALLALGREVYGARASHVVLLPPASVDAVLLAGLDRGLRDAGLDPDRLRGVFLVYELVDGRLHCEVQRVRLRGERERALRLRINLSG